MYNPISIVNMHHGLNLNGSSPERGIQLNQPGVTPPRLFQESGFRQHRNANPMVELSPSRFLPDNFANKSHPKHHERSRIETRCSGCEVLESRLSIVEDELRSTNDRFEEFQQDIMGHLNRLASDFHNLSGGLRNRATPRYSETTFLDSARPPIATPSVKQTHYENYGLEKDPTHRDDAQQVIVETCVQLERLIADASSRLNP